MAEQSKWTLDTLKELFEQRFASSENSVQAAFKASEKAIDKSEAAQTAYNARSNEFRAALDDQSKTFLPRSEAEVSFKQMREQIATLQQSDSRGEGATGAAAAAKTNTLAVIYLVVIASLQALAGIAALIFYLATKKINHENIPVTGCLVHNLCHFRLRPVLHPKCPGDQHPV